MIDPRSTCSSSMLLTSWRVGKDCCSWGGVTCDMQTGIFLEALLKTWPNSVNCTSTKWMFLLRQQMLSLISLLWPCFSFKTLDCKVTSHQKFFLLPKWEVLGLIFNENLRAYLPVFSSRNSPLNKLLLASTSFGSKLPGSIGNLKSLQVLDIGDGSFTGSIPFSIGRLTGLFQNLSC